MLEYLCLHESHGKNGSLASATLITTLLQPFVAESKKCEFEEHINERILRHKTIDEDMPMFVSETNKLLRSDEKIELRTLTDFKPFKMRLGKALKEIGEKLAKFTTPQNFISTTNSAETSAHKSELQQQILDMHSLEIKFLQIVGKLISVLSTELLDSAEGNIVGTEKLTSLIRRTEKLKQLNATLSAIIAHDEAQMNAKIPQNELRQFLTKIKNDFEFYFHQNSALLRFFESKLEGIFKYASRPESINLVVRYARGLDGRMDLAKAANRVSKLNKTAAKKQLELIIILAKISNKLLIGPVNEYGFGKMIEKLNSTNFNEKVDDILAEYYIDDIIIHRELISDVLKEFGLTVESVKAISHFIKDKDGIVVGKFETRVESNNNPGRKPITFWHMLECFSELLHHYLYGLCLTFLDYEAMLTQELLEGDKLLMKEIISSDNGFLNND